MNKLITLLALCCAVNAGDFKTSTNALGEIKLEKYLPEKMESVVKIPQYVDRIGNWAFQNRIEVQIVYLPNKTRYIGAGAFYGCSNMQRIRISPATLSIGDLAFSRCIQLKSALIPADCELFGSRTFEGCFFLGAWQPWIAYKREGNTLAIIWEGRLQSSTNLTDWADLPEDSGIRQIEMKEIVNFFRTRE